MAIRKIARMGNPVLRKKARPLRPDEIGSPALQQLIADMIETMADANGIGLAAPQIHESLQLAIIGFDEGSARYPGMGNQPLEVFINPRITVLDPALQEYWEGCLSIPEIRARVARPRKIQVDWLDVHGNAKTRVAEGFLATVFQHELDHLEGVLFLDRIRVEPGRTPIAFLSEFSKFGLATRDSVSQGEIAD
jgi:peptide deformylase